MSDHVHRLAVCPECEPGDPCIYCDGRGYFEVCWICGAAMGNAGRKQRRRAPGTSESTVHPTDTSTSVPGASGTAENAGGATTEELTPHER